MEGKKEVLFDWMYSCERNHVLDGIQNRYLLVCMGIMEEGISKILFIALG